jgi:hypothetical protein
MICRDKKSKREEGKLDRIMVLTGCAGSKANAHGKNVYCESQLVTI